MRTISLPTDAGRLDVRISRKVGTVPTLQDDGSIVEVPTVARKLAIVASAPVVVQTDRGTDVRKAGAVTIRDAEVPELLAMAGASALASRFSGTASGPLTDAEVAALAALTAFVASARTLAFGADPASALL